MALPVIVPALAALAVQYLPDLARAFGSPRAADAIEAASNVVKTVTGTDDAAEAAQALASMPPEQIAQFKIRLAEIAAADREAERQAHLEEVRAIFADVASARAQTQALAASGSSIAWGAPVVSLVVTLSFAVMLYIVLTKPIPAAASEPAILLLGTLAAAFGQVCNYWLGSSSGSARKDAMLGAQIAGPLGQGGTR